MIELQYKAHNKLMGVVPIKLMITCLLLMNINTKIHEIKEKYFVKNHLWTLIYFFVIDSFIPKNDLFLKLQSEFYFFLFGISTILRDYILIFFTSTLRKKYFILFSSSLTVIINILEIKMKKSQINSFEFFQKNKRK